MNIEYIREYIELVKCMNFTRASEKLFISQPVLSRHVQLIEEECGSKLLYRSKHSVTLTEEGELFFREAEKIVAAYDNLMSSLQTIKSGYNKRLRVGVMYYGIDEYLSPFIKTFRAKYPDLLFQVTPGNPMFQIDNIFKDKLDIGIFEQTPWVGSHRLCFETIHHEPIVAVVNENHPLANEEYIYLKQLTGTAMIDINDYFYEAYHAKIADMCEKHGYIITETHLVDCLESIFLRIQSDGGTHIMPKHLSKTRFSHVKYLNIADKGCSAEMVIAYKKDNPNPAIKNFIKMYMEKKHEFLGTPVDMDIK